MPIETGQEDAAAIGPYGTGPIARRDAPALALEIDQSLCAHKGVAPDPGPDPELIAGAPEAPPVQHDAAARIAAAPDSRILFRALALKSRLAPLERLIAPYRARALRSLDRQAARPMRRRRIATGASAMLNIALLAIMFIYGRVVIRAPDRPVDSMSVVFVDLPEPLPLPELRDPEIAPPQPLPEPLIEPEPEPAPPETEPEPEPAPPEPEAEPEPAPEPELQPPEPLLPTLTQEPQFLPPAEENEPEPFIPEPAPAPEPEPQEPAPAEPQPLDPGPAQETPVAEASEPEDDKDEEEQPAAAEAAPKPEALAVEERKPAQNDDAYDEDPFAAPRLALPQVDLPDGETSSAPGQSGVMAIFCPDEFKDKEKAAECAGRPEIRSGWKPGGSGEDFGRAVELLKQQRERGDYSAGNFGTEAQRRAEELKKQLELNDFRKSQDDINNLGLQSNDPAAGSRPDIGPAAVEPSWTRRDDPQVDQKDINKLKKELDAAADAKAKANDD